jgi:hypothetical protein
MFCIQVKYYKYNDDLKLRILLQFNLVRIWPTGKYVQKLITNLHYY